MDEYPEEATLHIANVYSYMLCKYNWFNSKNQKYFETQETIAEGCRVSVSAVKTAIRFLTKNNLITVSKVPSAQHNKNQYTIADVYNIYSVNNEKHVKDVYIREYEEEDLGLPW